MRGTTDTWPHTGRFGIRCRGVLISCLLAAAALLVWPGESRAATLVANSGKCPLYRGADLYNFVRVYYHAGSGYQLVVAPTQLGRVFANNDFNFGWAAMVSCAPSHQKTTELLGKTTIRQQFDCHAYWGVRKLPDGSWAGGTTWDLEGWKPARANVSAWIWDIPPCGATVSY